MEDDDDLDCFLLDDKYEDLVSFKIIDKGIKDLYQYINKATKILGKTAYEDHNMMIQVGRNTNEVLFIIKQFTQNLIFELILEVKNLHYSNEREEDEVFLITDLEPFSNQIMQTWKADNQSQLTIASDCRNRLKLTIEAEISDMSAKSYTVLTLYDPIHFLEPFKGGEDREEEWRFSIIPQSVEVVAKNMKVFSNKNKLCVSITKLAYNKVLFSWKKYYYSKAEVEASRSIELVMSEENVNKKVENLNYDADCLANYLSLVKDAKKISFSIDNEAMMSVEVKTNETMTMIGRFPQVQVYMDEDESR